MTTIELIISIVKEWAPGITAILSIIFTVIKSSESLNFASKEMKKILINNDMQKRLDAIIEENRRLVECNKILIDSIHKIKGYTDIQLEKKQ